MRLVLVAMLLVALTACNAPVAPPVSSPIPAPATSALVTSAPPATAPPTAVPATPTAPATATPTAPYISSRIPVHELPGIGHAPSDLALISDKLYVLNTQSFNLAVIISNQIAKFIPLGERPAGGLASPAVLAADPAQKRLYVANLGNQNISLFVDGQVTVSQRIGAELRTLYFFENRLYAGVTNSNLVLVLDASTLQTLDRITIPNAFQVTHFIGDPAHHRVYADIFGKLAVIDSTTFKVVSTLALKGDSPGLLAYLPNDRLVISVYGPSGKHNLVTLNPASGAETGRVAVGDSPQAVALRADGLRAYVANTYSNDVSVVDLKTMTSLGTIPTGFAPMALALDENAKRLYVANSNSDNVTVVDTESNQVVTRIPTVMVATALVANESTGRVYVANAPDDSVYVIQGGKPVKTISVGRYPTGLARDAAANRILVANSVDGNLSVIDESDFSVRASKPITDYPGGVAIDPAHARAFVGSAIVDLKTLAPIGSLSVPAQSQVGGAASTVRPFRVWVNAHSNRLYAVARNGLSGSGGAYVIHSIDGDTLKSRATLDVRMQNSDVALDIDPETDRVFVANQYDLRLNAYDAKDTRVFTATLSARMNDLVYNPQTHHLFVSLYENSVQVLDTNSFGQVARFSINGAHKLGRLGNVIYVASEDGTLTTIQDMTTAVPPPMGTATPYPSVTPRPPIISAGKLAPVAAPVVHAGWTSYTNANEEIHAMAFDAQGNLWTASDGGAVRWNFKDSTYTKYTLEHGIAANKLISVAVGRDGAVWFGTDGFGVSRFDGKVWKTFGQKDGLPSDVINAIAVAPDGVVWFGTPDGASRYDGKAFKNYKRADGLTGELVWGVAVAKDGTVWFGTGGGGVSAFDGKSWKTFNSLDGLANNVVMRVTAAPDGAVWFATNHGISRYDGKTWKSYFTSDGVPSDYMLAILATADGTIWTGGQYGPGVSRFDGKSWKTYTPADGLAGDKILSFVAAPDGTVWAGTQYGISHFENQVWKSYTLADGLGGDPPITNGVSLKSISIAADGTAWFGMYGGGVSRFDGKNWKTFSQADGLPSNDVMAVAAGTAGTVWAGTTKGAAFYNGTVWKTYTKVNGLAGNAISVVSVAPDGTVWFGTEMDGVSRFSGNTFKNWSKADGLASPTVHAIVALPGGQAWVATSDGVSSYDGKTWKTYTQANGLGGNDVYGLAVAPNGAVWFATTNGVSRYDGKAFKNYTTADGLIENDAFSIAATTDGSIWARVKSDAMRYDGRTWKIYTAADGLDRGVFFVTAAPDGAVWFATGSGASRFK